MSCNLTPAEVQALKREISSSLHCALPGIVESFDAVSQTACIRPAVRRASAALPVLRDVPVFFPGSRGSGITWPVEAGDECLLVFADFDIDRWFETGEESAADSARQHALPDAFAFVGFRSRPNALADFPEAPRFFDGALAPHNHDDRYYTESETDALLAGKADAGHDHDGRYYTEGEADALLAGKLDRDASSGIAYGTCDTAAAAADKVISVSGKTGWSLEAGALICIRFTYTNTAQNPAFNVNGTGAKGVYYNTARITTSSLSYAGYASRPMLFMYDGTQYVFLGWSIDANTTYSNASLGQGYGTCATAEAAAEKAVTLSSYALATGGVVAVKFTYTVPASATMNINSKGAKPVWYMGAAIPAGIIQAGDTAAFVYDGTRYHLVGIDRQTHDDRYYTESEMDTKLSGKKNTQTAVSDPSASGTSATFIATLSQNAQGVITPTKKTVQSASASQSGLMSSGDKTKLDGMAMVSYGTCATAAGTAAKAVTLSNTSWQLKAGSIVGVKFSNTNTFSATADSHVTLNVNSTGAKNILYNTSLPTGTATWAFGTANRVLYYMYDGTNWVWLSWSIDANDNTVPSAYCSTAAATAAKTASCSGYALLSKSYIQVIVTAANTAASALTLNINSKGAKPVYINGTASGTTNYTLPAGSYLVYYDGTNYQFRTDGQIPGPARSVALGGTGQTGTGATATIADIATAAADCEITAAQYAYWGKVAMVRLVVKKTTAVSSGTTTLCTMASGKRPKYTAPATWAWNNGAVINTSGTVQVNGAISAGASLTILATYILA